MNEFLSRLGTLSLLLFVVLCKAALLVLLMTYGDIGLGPDEAQYWTWSKDLSWGYYSKPPGIAWQIWLGTYHMGDNELGVRFMSVVISSALPFLVYVLAWVCGLKSRTCFWAGALMAFTPLGIASSFFAITDVGMIFFWILACIALTAPLNQTTALLLPSDDETKDGINISTAVPATKLTPTYWLVGLLIGLGALFKWPIYILWAFILCLFPFVRQFISRHFFVGVLISLMGLIPTLIWNFNHDWVTFRHVFSTLYVPSTTAIGKAGVFNGNFWEFLGAQMALFSPILFILLLMSFWIYCKEIRLLPSALNFCGALCFSLLGIFLLLSVFKKMQGNWCDFAYPSGIVFLCWFCCERAPRTYPWLKAGLVLSVLLCLLAFSLPFLQRSLPFNTSFKLNPFKHNLGWHQLKKELAELGFNPEKDFLFSDKYQITSILSFYNPTQQRAYFLNLHGVRKNQFSFWPGMQEEQKGKDGYFVLVENAPHLDKLDEKHREQYRLLLSDYFKTVEYLGNRPLFTIHGTPVKEAAFFKGVEYNGKTPTEPELY